MYIDAKFSDRTGYYLTSVNNCEDHTLKGSSMLSSIHEFHVSRSYIHIHLSYKRFLSTHIIGLFLVVLVAQLSEHCTDIAEVRVRVSSRPNFFWRYPLLLTARVIHRKFINM